MKFRNTLILAILVVLVGVFIYLDKKREKKTEEAKEAANKLLAFNKDSVSAIILQPDNIELKKVNSSWEIASPVQYKAEESAVNALLNVLESAQRDRKDITRSPSEHANYGLDPARQQVILHHDGKQDTIYLGDHNTTSTLVYTRINSDPEVMLTGIGVATNAKKPLFDWRNKDLLNFETSAVNRLLLKTPNARFELKKEGGKWQMVAPMKASADESKVSQVMNKVRYGRISEFATEQLQEARPYGLDKPGYEFTVFFGDNDAQKTVHFGKRDGAFVYAYDPARPQVYKVDTSIVHDLNVNVMDLRNKKLAEFQSWNADYVELNYADTLKIICEKDTAGTWQITAPEQRKAKSWKISNITGNLSSLEATKFVDENAGDLKPYGLDNPRAVITVKEKGNEVARALIGKEKGDRVYAKAANSTAVVEIKKDDADRLFVTLADLAEE
jgi:uncharacterized protein YpmB